MTDEKITWQLAWVIVITIICVGFVIGALLPQARHCEVEFEMTGKAGIEALLSENRTQKLEDNGIDLDGDFEGGINGRYEGPCYLIEKALKER